MIVPSIKLFYNEMGSKFMVHWLRQEIWNTVPEWKMSTPSQSAVFAELTGVADDFSNMRAIGAQTLQQNILDIWKVGGHSGHHSSMRESAIISFIKLQEFIWKLLSVR
jgi:hypothetical protein